MNNKQFQLAMFCASGAWLQRQMPLFFYLPDGANYYDDQTGGQHVVSNTSTIGGSIYDLSGSVETSLLSTVNTLIATGAFIQTGGTHNVSGVLTVEQNPDWEAGGGQVMIRHHPCQRFRQDYR